ncbi:MAG TPA: GAF domain-containing protein, partial [Methylomirabilota bacterium]|nr:GAF domain-containing protein [Methylomirabilota bacterium]
MATRPSVWERDHWSIVAATVLILAQALLVAGLLRGRSAQRRTRSRLEGHVRFEACLAELLVPADGIDGALARGLGQVVTLLGVDRGHLEEYVRGGRGIRLSSARSGIDAMPQPVDADLFPWTVATLRRGDVVRFSRRSELPAAAAIDRVSHARRGTRSHLALPLRAGGATLGALSFDAVRAARAWPDDVVERLRLVSEALAGAVVRKRMEASLAERLHFERLL